MKLEYELIDNNNINLATSIQYTIFPAECAYLHYKYSIDTGYKTNRYYIIKHNNIPVGTIGLYFINDKIDNESIWLGWFGVLPEFRGKGYGRQSLMDMIDKSKQFGKKYLRLYTNDDGTSTARPLYRSVMQLYEKYNNKEDYNYNGNCLIYTYSLCDDGPKKWNDRFANIKEDIEDEGQGNDIWKDKYNILILSNPENEEFIEDEYIATAFREDGHRVVVKWIDYDEKLDEKFDVIIRRDTWVEDEKDTSYYKQKNDILIQRLSKKNIKTVNLVGLDGIGKQYLCELYKQQKQVVPTVDNIQDINKFGKVEEYVLKDNNSFGDGIGQKVVKAEDLEKEFKEGYLIQPKLKFKSEIQCYFVGQKLMFVLEYSPSKYPDYPEPNLITLKKQEENLAYEFAKFTGVKYGVQRIDFLKLENDELILLEIEDNSPYMDLIKIDKNLRDTFINEYKNNIYEYLK